MEKEKRELIKLIVVTAVCFLIFVVYLINIDSVPEGILNKNEEYTINYKEPVMLCDEVPEKLWDDPPVVKQVNLATPKPKLTEAKEPEMTYLGVYTLTAYCATGNPCADGVEPSVNHTIACNDPMLWHRWVMIEGYGSYYCHDVGGMPTNTIIDVFVGSYDEAIQFGVREANVYLIE